MPGIEDIYRRFPRGTLDRIMKIEGPVLKAIADNRTGRFIVRKVTHGGLGRVGIQFARMTGLLEGRAPIALAMGMLRYFFEPILEEVSADESKAVFALTSCPYGWSPEGDEAICDAVMDLERELVSGMGATLVIEERIPQGAPKCRFTLSVKS